MKICIVSANYYPNISKNLYKGANIEFNKYNKINKKQILRYEKIIVPGVFEIPYVISSNVKKFDGFIALGCVIKGETPHFDFISTASINALLNISTLHKKPITNGILTCLNKKQAQTRADVGMKNKGGEAALALIQLLQLSRKK
jgi:6,7-dimethyl-8-ribityllumazine synthase